MEKKYVYYFNEGNAGMKHLLGGKGANLAEMTKLGIPVPPGFTITTEVCDIYNKNNKKYPAEVDSQIEENLKKLEKAMGAGGAGFGDNENPLLVSVRSGAAASMPGMMDTILNLGLNDESIKSLIKKTSNERFAYDAYRRLLTMFGDVVMEIEHKHFEDALSRIKKTKGVELDTQLDADDMKKVVDEFKKIIRQKTKKEFPQEPKQQLDMAIKAVFNSWNNKRAIAYRKIHSITGLLGTAVNVQAMVFGNMGDSSGTGVAFTRNPSIGENKFYGEYLMNAQGEDVVAGIRTPEPISKLKKEMPKVYEQLEGIYKKLENHYKDMQDIEFTIQEGRLYMLQTRTGKRTAHAALKIAVDMVNEGLIDKKTAVMRVEPDQINQLLHKQLDPVAKQKAELLAKGLPASPGAAVGIAVFDAERAVELSNQGEKVILVRTETSPEDIQGMNAAQGILTARGGMTSHAAVVARGMGKCCVAGCSDISVNEEEKVFTAKGITIKEKEWITLDGSTGEVIKGKVPVVDPQLSGDFGKLMEWADSFRKIGVRANADIPKDAKVALNFGAEGIGLCRTEHMFFEGDRIKAVREMILADDLEGRSRALKKLLPIQRSDFKGLFEIMKGKPVKIRLLDPPLHEFLPKTEEEIKELSKETGRSAKDIKEKIKSLHEFNPMLGHRGCRLGITYPEISEMQTRAIIEAAIDVMKQHKESPIVEIMVPLVGHVKEFLNQKEVIVKTAEHVMKEHGVGTMIEVPRGALTADEIAKEADFFSFGTNDLTQMTCGFSRDDAGKFLAEYVEKGIYAKDPFQTIDRDGVGIIMRYCVEKARKVKPKMHIGICGEHGGDPDSIKFCYEIGLNYVSCSPYRVPVARLAAAQSSMKGVEVSSTH